MATILLNGVVTDASSISGSDLNDKLTVSGGEDGLSVDLAAGDDAVEIYADSENITDAEIRVSEGNDTILVLAEDGSNNNNINGADDFAGLPISLGDSLLGGPGRDVIRVEDGLVQLTGAVKGNEDNDTIHVANINGGTVNGNSGSDTLRVGVFAAEVAGSQAANAVTNGSVMGGQGGDTIIVNADVTGSAVRGNEGDDTITITGDISGTNTINGNAGDDVIDTTNLDGDVTVIGGKGNDIFRAGNGQTLRGGMGADTYSVETAGGVTIDRFDRLDRDGDADDADCFCDDVIQVDGNKIDYDTYEYKLSLVDHTSASSWAGNIKVKGVVEGIAVGTNTSFTYKGTKTETLNATAVIAYKVSDVKTAKTAGGDFKTALPRINYPATGFRPTADGGRVTGLDNGNDPRVPRSGNANPFTEDRMVESRGFGFASVTGYWRGQNDVLGGKQNTGSIRSALAYTRTAFEKGDFSFLELTAKAGAGDDGTQKLVFDDVSNATITNHWRSYNKEKTTDATSLYALSFGTANFGAVVTGRANLMISDGIADKTYVPTQDQLLGATKLAAWNFTGTGWTRQVTAKAGATITLDLDGTFDAYVRRNAEDGDIGAASRGGVLTTIDGVQWSFHEGIKWSQAGTLGLRTLSVATSIFGPIKTNSTLVTTGGPTANAIGAQGTRFGGGTFKQQTRKQAAAQTVALRTNYSNPANLQTTFVGANQALRDTAVATGSLVVKIAVQETALDAGAGGLAGAVSRAVIPNQTFDITSCEFPATIYGNIGSTQNRLNRHNLVTEAAAVTFSGNDVAAGEFNTRYLWNAGDMRAATEGRSLQDAVAISALPTSNGCTSFSCEVPATAGQPNGARVTGEAVSILNVANVNNGFFSGSEWSVDVLAAAGMGDNVTVRNPDANDADTEISTAVGAPFRVLFFDTEGTDNGLYIYSGTANYAAGDVTAINTAPNTMSAFGGKETIVRATVKDGGSALALSDINFV